MLWPASQPASLPASGCDRGRARSAGAALPWCAICGATAGAFWHTRATEPGARSTAYGLLVSCVVVLIGIIVPAISGAGLFLLPATLVITVAAVLGTIKFIQDFRAGRHLSPSGDHRNS